MSKGLSFGFNLDECLKYSSEPVTTIEFININAHLGFWSKARARLLFCSGFCLSACHHSKSVLSRQAASGLTNNHVAFILSSQWFW